MAEMIVAVSNIQPAPIHTVEFVIMLLTINYLYWFEKNCSTCLVDTFFFLVLFFVTRAKELSRR